MDDFLEGFLKANVKAFSNLNPRGDILSNLSGFASDVAGGTFGQIDFGISDASPEQTHSNEMDMFSFGDISSTVDEMGLGTENSSDPFAGLANIGGMFLGAAELLGVF